MDLLAESAVRVTLLAFGVTLVLHALRIRAPRLVHRAWTVVVVVMLLLPVFMVWGPELPVPLLPSPAANSILAPGAGGIAAGEPMGIAIAAATPPDGSHRQLTWAALALTMYVAGVSLFLVRLGIGLRRARAIRRRAVRVETWLVHPACVTPMTVGIIAPVVILPTDWASWNEDELSAVLAHEEEHVRRRDPLIAVLALLNRAIFWFHPLAWWLQRRIAGLSEQACDAVVMTSGHDRDAYSACLLRFARRAAAAGGRLAPMATPMPGTGLRERLGRLGEHLPPPSRSRVACALVAGTALVVVCASGQPAAAPEQTLPSAVGGRAAWSVETSEHFEIVHEQLSADRVRDTVLDLEAAYGQLSAALKFDMPRRVRIVLVRGDRELGAQVGTVVPQADALTPRGQIVLSLESLDRRTGIAVHELTHQFAFEIVPETSRITPVLIEGLAEHQRGAWKAEDERLIRTAAAAGAIPTVAVLVNTDRHWAHAVFDFVATEHGAEGVRQLLFALRASVTLSEAVPIALGVTLDQFDERFHGYVTATFGQP